MKLIALILSLFILTGCEATILTKDEYLSKNSKIINLTDREDYKGLEMLDENIKNKDIILTGESHGINLDDELRIKLLRYLKENINIKYYLMETSYSNAYFMNKYLKTGDEEILKEIYKNSYGTYSYNKDEYNFIKYIYEYNKTLDEKDKIEIIGIDIEFQMKNTYKYIKEVFNEEKISQDIKEYIEKLNVNSSYYLANDSIDERYKKLKENCEDFLNEINNNQDFYKSILNEEFTGVKNVLESTITLADVSLDTENSTQLRENRIYNNFIALDEQLEKGKYFGQWGNLHIVENMSGYESEKVDSLAIKLRKSEIYKGKVLSISYLYQNCMSIEKPEVNKGYTESKIDDYITEEFKVYNDRDCYIFDINKKNSPYEEKSYIDYIVLINNSKASKTLDFH